VDADRVGQLIAQLDDDSFVIREKATCELCRLVRWAEPAVRKALANPPSLEAQRRMEQVLRQTKGDTPAGLERVRLMRVIDFLEKAGTPEAKQLVETIATAA